MQYLATGTAVLGVRRQSKDRGDGRVVQEAVGQLRHRLDAVLALDAVFHALSADTLLNQNVALHAPIVMYLYFGTTTQQSSQVTKV